MELEAVLEKILAIIRRNTVRDGLGSSQGLINTEVFICWEYTR